MIVSRLASLCFASVAIVAAAGCSVSTTSNSITVKAQKKFTRDTSKTAATAWSGQRITVYNVNGDLTVDTVAGDVIRADATLVAYADDDAHQADADASLAETETSFTIDEPAGGPITITCGRAGTHGTSGSAVSGCALHLYIPQGSSVMPVDLIETANNGSAVANGIIGSAIVHSGTGSVSLGVTPTLGAAVEASTDVGAATLALPSTWAADQVLIDLGQLTSDFPDVTTATTSRGTAGTGAHSAVLKSGNGDLALRALR
jgi:hypothetical protein